MVFQILWIIAGLFCGWIGVEFISGAVKRGMPIAFNFMMAFVGGLTAYTLTI